MTKIDEIELKKSIETMKEKIAKDPLSYYSGKSVHRIECEERLIKFILNRAHNGDIERLMNGAFGRPELINYNIKDGEDKALIKEFLTKMVTQNNCGTDMQFYYTIRTLGVAGEWEEKGTFFTEAEAKNHLTAKYYRYSSDAYTCITFLWRALEFENFILSLFRYFKIEKKEKTK